MLSRWMIRLRALRRGRRAEAEFDEELRYHLERLIEHNLKGGMGPGEARRAALREFGNPVLLREEARETWRWRCLDDLARDLRYAMRWLLANRGFTAAAVLSLGLGIGATTTLFSVIDALDFRPLPYEEPERLVWLAELMPETVSWCPRCPTDTGAITATDWWNQSSSYQAFGLQAHTGAYVRRNGVSVHMDAGRASAGFFDVLGVPLALGRQFLPEDTTAGAEPVVILSHAMWRKHFDADPGVVGTRFEYFEDPALQIRRSSRVVGVLPEGFRFARDYPFWIPLTDESGRRAGPRIITAVARLRPGIDRAAAEAELRALHAGLTEEYPDAYEGRDVAVRSLREHHGMGAGGGRGVLFSITAVVLFIAALNVAGMLTARGEARRQELTVRRALGASRAGLVRQLLVEGVALGLGGGLLGIVMAGWGVRFANLVFDTARYGPAARIDHRVLAFGIGLSIAVGLLTALPSARRTGRVDLHSALRQPMETGGRTRLGWTLNALLVSQIAAGLILLTAAGLLGSEYLEIRYFDLGYDPVGLYEAPLAGRSEYDADPELLRSEAEDARTRIETIPGIASASLMHQSATSPSVVRAEGRIQPPPPDEYIAVEAVDADYFETLGAPILAGRALHENDAAGAPLVAVVNQAAASRFWAGRSAIGRRVFLGSSESQGQWVTVVGVVQDIEWGMMVRRHHPRLYRPFPQGPIYHPYIRAYFRVAEDRPELLRAVEAALRSELGRPTTAVVSLEDELGERFVAQRINAVSVNGFAAFALLLAAVGIYSSVAYAVARRVREIGVRLALGAARSSVLMLFLRHAAVIALVGVTLGLAGSVALTQAMQSFVSATSVTDPRVFAGAALMMVCAVLVATYLPARHATSVDPTITLRTE